jgi:hypothetical protein
LSTTFVPLAPEKEAVTLRAAVIVTVQVVVVPEHAPPQPENEAPDPGMAVSVTLVPAATLSVQSVLPPPHAMPEPVTAPSPVTDTVSAKVEPVVPPVNVALTLRAADIVTVQVVVVPKHAPLQPENEAPELGVAVSVTSVPEARF